MTNERAVEILNLDLDILGQHGGETAEAYKMAIQALEAQPCDDCISRQKALDCFEQTNTRQGAKYAIETLPSVTPQRSKGKWIEVLEHKDEFSSTWHYECSECKGRSYKGFEPLEKYCPNCGSYNGGGEDEDSD